MSMCLVVPGAQRQYGRANPMVVLAIVAVALLLATMVYITLDTDEPAATQSAGTVERAQDAATADSVPVAVETAGATATPGNFNSRQLPPPVATVPAQDSPLLSPTEERESVVIGGRLLEVIEEGAEQEKADAKQVPLSPPQ